MHIISGLKCSVVAIAITGLVGCQTSRTDTLARPEFNPKSGRTVAYIREGLTAATYSEDVKHCREQADQAADGYKPASTFASTGGTQGGGLLGAFLGGLALGIAEGAISASKTQTHADSTYERCMNANYERIHLPKRFLGSYARAGSDPDAQGAVLQRVTESEEFEEFAAWHAVIASDDPAAFKSHAEQYPVSLFGDLPRNFVAYLDSYLEKLTPVRRNSHVGNNFALVYGLGRNGWATLSGTGGGSRVECGIRTAATIKLQIRDGWVQGLFRLHDSKKRSLVGFVQENGKFDLVADWPAEAPLVISGSFTDKGTFEGNLRNSGPMQSCENAFLQLREPASGSSDGDNWTGVPPMSQAALEIEVHRRFNSVSVAGSSTGS